MLKRKRDVLTYPAPGAGCCEEGRMYTALPLLKRVERLFPKTDPRQVEYESRTHDLSGMRWAPKPLSQHDNRIYETQLLSFIFSWSNILFFQ